MAQGSMDDRKGHLEVLFSVTHQIYQKQKALSFQKIIISIRNHVTLAGTSKFGASGSHSSRKKFHLLKMEMANEHVVA